MKGSVSYQKKLGTEVERPAQELRAPGDAFMTMKLISPDVCLMKAFSEPGVPFSADVLRVRTSSGVEVPYNVELGGFILLWIRSYVVFVNGAARWRVSTQQQQSVSVAATSTPTVDSDRWNVVVQEAGEESIATTD